jgi:hypothetical protein
LGGATPVLTFDPTAPVGLMGDASPGAPQPTFTVVFPAPGTYHYRCLVHGTDMSGVITVTAESAGRVDGRARPGAE